PVCRSPGTSNGWCSASLNRLGQDEPRSATARPLPWYCVLEFGPAETLSPVGAMSPAYSRLCRPHNLPWRAHPREKPWFSTPARYFRERRTVRWREMDSNSWYRGTNSLGFPKHPGIAGGSSTGEGDVGGGLRRRRL